MRWCLVCDNEVETLTLDEAAVLLNITLSSLNQQIAESSIHFIAESNALQPLICFNSLLRDGSNSLGTQILRLEEKK